MQLRDRFEGKIETINTYRPKQQISFNQNLLNAENLLKQNQQEKSFKLYTYLSNEILGEKCENEGRNQYQQIFNSIKKCSYYFSIKNLHKIGFQILLFLETLIKQFQFYNEHVDDLIEINNIIASNYKKIKNFEKAKQYLNDSLALIIENGNQSKHLTITYLNLTSLFFDLNNDIMIEHYVKQALESSKYDLQNSRSKNNCYNINKYVLNFQKAKYNQGLYFKRQGYSEYDLVFRNIYHALDKIYNKTYEMQEMMDNAKQQFKTNTVNKIYVNRLLTNREKSVNTSIEMKLNSSLNSNSQRVNLMGSKHRLKSISKHEDYKHLLKVKAPNFGASNNSLNKFIKHQKEYLLSKQTSLSKDAFALTTQPDIYSKVLSKKSIYTKQKDPYQINSYKSNELFHKKTMESPLNKQSIDFHKFNNQKIDRSNTEKIQTTREYGLRFSEQLVKDNWSLSSTDSENKQQIMNFLDEIEQPKVKKVVKQKQIQALISKITTSKSNQQSYIYNEQQQTSLQEETLDKIEPEPKQSLASILSLNPKIKLNIKKAPNRKLKSILKTEKTMASAKIIQKFYRRYKVKQKIHMAIPDLKQHFLSSKRLTTQPTKREATIVQLTNSDNEEDKYVEIQEIQQDIQKIIIIQKNIKRWLQQNIYKANQRLKYIYNFSLFQWGFYIVFYFYKKNKQYYLTAFNKTKNKGFNELKIDFIVLKSMTEIYYLSNMTNGQIKKRAQSSQDRGGDPIDHIKYYLSEYFFEIFDVDYKKNNISLSKYLSQYVCYKINNKNTKRKESEESVQLQQYQIDKIMTIQSFFRLKQSRKLIQIRKQRTILEKNLQHSIYFYSTIEHGEKFIKAYQLSINYDKFEQQFKIRGRLLQKGYIYPEEIPLPFETRCGTQITIDEQKHWAKLLIQSAKVDKLDGQLVIIAERIEQVAFKSTVLSLYSQIPVQYRENQHQSKESFRKGRLRQSFMDNFKEINMGIEVFQQKFQFNIIQKRTQKNSIQNLQEHSINIDLLTEINEDYKNKLDIQIFQSNINKLTYRLQNLNIFFKQINEQERLKYLEEKEIKPDQMNGTKILSDIKVLIKKVEEDQNNLKDSLMRMIPSSSSIVFPSFNSKRRLSKRSVYQNFKKSLIDQINNSVEFTIDLWHITSFEEYILVCSYIKNNNEKQLVKLAINESVIKKQFQQFIYINDQESAKKYILDRLVFDGKLLHYKQNALKVIEDLDQKNLIKQRIQSEQTHNNINITKREINQYGEIYRIIIDFNIRSYQFIIKIDQLQNILSQKCYIDIQHFNVYLLEGIIKQKDSMQLVKFFKPTCELILDDLMIRIYENIININLRYIIENMNRYIYKHFINIIQQHFRKYILKRKFQLIQKMKQRSLILLSLKYEWKSYIQKSYDKIRYVLNLNCLKIYIFVKRVFQSSIKEAKFEISILQLQNNYLDIIDSQYIDIPNQILYQDWQNIKRKRNLLSKKKFNQLFDPILEFLQRNISFKSRSKQIRLVLNDQTIPIKEIDKHKEPPPKFMPQNTDIIPHNINNITNLYQIVWLFKKLQSRYIQKLQKRKLFQLMLKTKEMSNKNLNNTNKIKRTFIKLNGEIYICNIYQRDTMYNIECIKNQRGGKHKTLKATFNYKNMLYNTGKKQLSEYIINQIQIKTVNIDGVQSQQIFFNENKFEKIQLNNNNINQKKRSSKGIQKTLIQKDLQVKLSNFVDYKYTKDTLYNVVYTGKDIPKNKNIDGNTVHIQVNLFEMTKLYPLVDSKTQGFMQTVAKQLIDGISLDAENNLLVDTNKINTNCIQIVKNEKQVNMKKLQKGPNEFQNKKNIYKAQKFFEGNKYFLQFSLIERKLSTIITSKQDHVFDDYQIKYELKAINMLNQNNPPIVSLLDVNDIMNISNIYDTQAHLERAKYIFSEIYIHNNNFLMLVRDNKAQQNFEKYKNMMVYNKHGLLMIQRCLKNRKFNQNYKVYKEFLENNKNSIIFKDIQYNYFIYIVKTKLNYLVYVFNTDNFLKGSLIINNNKLQRYISQQKNNKFQIMKLIDVNQQDKYIQIYLNDENCKQIIKAKDMEFVQ